MESKIWRWRGSGKKNRANLPGGLSGWLRETLSLAKFAFFEKRRLSFSLPINHGLTVKRCTVIMKSGSSLGGRVWRLHLYSWRKDKRDGVDLNVMKIATLE